MLVLCLDVFSEGSYDSTRHRVYEFRENALTSADNDDRANHGLVPLSKDGAIWLYHLSIHHTVSKVAYRSTPRD